MKHAFAAILALGLGLGALPAAATGCEDTCSAVIVPGTEVIHLPLEEWFDASGTFVTTTGPSYGIWDDTYHMYAPGADFWVYGIDRMTITVNGGNPRSVVLVAAHPTEEGNSAIYSTPVHYAGGTYGSTGYESIGLPSRGNSAGVARLAGMTISGVGPPTANESQILMKLANFVEVHLLDDPPRLVARVIHSGVCNEAEDLGQIDCDTQEIGLDHDANQLFTAELSLGYDKFLHSAADRYTLSFKVCSPEHWGTECRVTELANLGVTELGGASTLQVGLVSGDTRNTTIDIGKVKIWRLIWAADDEHGQSHFDAFDGSAASFWTPQGSPGIDEDFGASNLAEMLFASVVAYKDEAPIEDSKRFRLMMDLDVDDLELGDGDSVVAFTAHSSGAIGGTTKAFDLFVKKVGTGPTPYFVRARLIADSGTVHASNLTQIGNGTTPIVLHFEAGNPGFLKVVVGSTLVDTLTAVNPTREADRYTVGATQPTLAENDEPGILRFDNVTTRFAAPPVVPLEEE